MPSYAAGPRPATVRLAQTSSQCIKETFNRYLPLPSSATRPANSVAPKPQIIARNRVRPRRSHKPSRSNLHSAPQPPASLTAVSFPGGFRTPAPVQAASSRWAVIRNPSQQQTHAAQQINFIIRSPRQLGQASKLESYGRGMSAYLVPDEPQDVCARYGGHRVEFRSHPPRFPRDRGEQAGRHR
jgi:hypothetical protein